jgi:hypothetical protein
MPSDCDSMDGAAGWVTVAKGLPLRFSSKVAEAFPGYRVVPTGFEPVSPTLRVFSGPIPLPAAIAESGR